MNSRVPDSRNAISEKNEMRPSQPLPRATVEADWWLRRTGAARVERTTHHMFLQDVSSSKHVCKMRKPCNVQHPRPFLTILNTRSDYQEFTAAPSRIKRWHGQLLWSLLTEDPPPSNTDCFRRSMMHLPQAGEKIGCSTFTQKKLRIWLFFLFS